MNNSNGNPHSSSSNTAVPMASSSNVRHIPIFVEGRPEPIFNTTNTSNSTTAAPPPDVAPFPKPSDYYPPGVQRIRSRDSECGTPDFQFQPFADTPTFRPTTHAPAGFRAGQHPHPHISTAAPPQHQQQQAAGYVEPTTPMGPPPGPIPMGYVPSAPGVPREVIQEPTTPLGPPPGPIPMGYVPSAVPPMPPLEPTSPLAPPLGAIPLPCDPSLVKQTEQPPEQQAAQAEKVSAAPPPPPPLPPTLSKGAAAVRDRRSTASPVGVAESETAARTTPGSDVPDHPSGTGGPAPPPLVNYIPIRVEQGPPAPSRSRDGRSVSATRQQPPPAEKEIESVQRTAVPRSPAPPRKATTVGEGGENAVLLNKLDTIRQEVEKLGERIQNFKGSRAEKEYLYLDDMLTKQLIALDGIDTAGKEEIRQLRKDSIAFVNSCLTRLDEKATEHGAQQQLQQLQDTEAADQQPSS